MPRATIPETTRELICNLYARGRTLQEIGDVFDVTRERIRQLLRAWNVASDMGGSHVRAFIRQTEVRRRRNERMQQKDSRTEALFGCSIEEVTRIAGPLYARAPWGAFHKRTPGPGLAYIDQRRNADLRLIEWNLSLPAWWQIWQESGRWEERGRGRSFGMCRHGDTGPYSVENVYIATGVQNMKDFYGVPENKARWRAALDVAHSRAA